MKPPGHDLGSRESFLRRHSCSLEQLGRDPTGAPCGAHRARMWEKMLVRAGLNVSEVKAGGLG